MKKLTLHVFAMLLILSACAQSPGVSKQANSLSNPSQAYAGSSTKQPSQKPVVMKLVQHQVVDREGTGLVASTYLLPADWKVEDRLYWEYRDPTVPIRFQSTLSSADGKLGIQIFPDVRASWNTGPAGTTGYMPPQDIISGMRDLINQERRGKNIRYVSNKILSDTPASNQQARSRSQAGIVTIEYDENGQTFEEEFYGKLDVSDMVTPSVYGNMESIIWGASALIAYRAPKGHLEDCRKIAQTISSSSQLTKPFYNRLAQVMQLLSDQFYQGVFQAGQISRIISQTNDQMIANIDASYQQTQRAQEHASEQFSDYMRGVDRYGDNGSEVQLPSGWDNAWVNDKGEYILTNTTGYDPGHDFSGNWRQLQKGN
jgi:hypothetical protein